MLVKTTKKDGHTRSILAYDAREGLKVVDKPGVQEVPDGHPRVERLIQEGVLEKVSKVSADTGTGEGDKSDDDKGEADKGEADKGEADKAKSSKKK